MDITKVLYAAQLVLAPAVVLFVGYLFFIGPWVKKRYVKKQMTFDLTKTPPTETEIQNRKAKVGKHFNRSQNLRSAETLLAVIITVGALISSFVGLLIQKNFGAYSLGIFGVSLFITIALKLFHEKLDVMENELSDLSPISEKLAEDILAFCKTDTTCEAYRVTVIKSGRDPIVAEYRVMEKFVELKKQQLNEQLTKQRQAEAYAKLHAV